jgi:Na+-transporting NADH:ubiquinone oxidoreductase subunit C
MVVIVAAVLSIAATVLKPKQQQNIRNEKMSSILASAGVESQQKMLRSYTRNISLAKW